MGNGPCSRRQRRALQTLLLLSVLGALLYGAALHRALRAQLLRAEAAALKHQQHQDSLSAQLQVVYEHRSRLEKSLQKERLEHKKAKEDFLVYKLEAQETLNKGRQDSNSRYSALNVQHQMLKSQHEELKKQHSDLEEEHRRQGEDFSRTFSDHKQRFLQLQQEKEQELSKLKETVYNLREENRQLRKAHQDIHVQLQDVKQQHKNLLAEREQLVVTLEDHKSALAAAQTQVAEYKQLKDTLNRIPSFRKTEDPEPQNRTQLGRPADGVAKEEAPAELREEPRNREDDWEKHEALPEHAGRPQPPTSREAAFEGDARARAAEERPVEEEHRRALEEEAMEQVGRAEHVQEEHDPAPEEQEGAQVPPSAKAVLRSPYEEQLELQRLEAQREEEARRAEEARLEQRPQGPLLHQPQQLDHGEPLAQGRAGPEEQHQQPRQRVRFDAVDNDVLQGAEDQAVPEEEGGAYERDNQHQDEAEEDPENEREPGEPGPQEMDPESEADRAAVGEINPADDPNNQGEDEFEEAEQVREENVPENGDPRRSTQQRARAAVQERVAMAGNPDQQEDTADEQYQEDGEEEGQEDLTEEKKRELDHNGDETYDENADDDKNREQEEQQVGDEKRPKAREAQYLEDEDEGVDGAAVAGRPHRRAEM